MSIFKACDIRGVVGEELNEAVARRIGRALGRMMLARGAGPVCLGGDFRRSTPVLKRAVCDGLLSAGMLVRDVGQAPTPAVYFAGRHLNCPHTVIVTASHNPARYNGIKFMIAGRPATPDLVSELQSRLAESTPGTASTKGAPTTHDVLHEYESHVRSTAAWIGRDRASQLQSRTLRIVLDGMGGAFAAIAPRVLRAAGCDIIEMRCAADPAYSTGDPNPASDGNLKLLKERVVVEKADLGIALDGDGDRAAFVDEAGTIIRPEQIGVLLARHCFERPTVVYDLKCASILARAVEAAGGTSIMQPSGHGFIKSTMIDRGADLGVEVSGHFFFKALQGGDDGLFVALVVAHILAPMGTRLSELIAPIGWPAITPDLRIPFTGDVRTVLDEIAAGCGGTVLRLDGVRAAYDDGWALARASITEPLITLRFEANSLADLKAVARRFLAGRPELYNSLASKLE
jgi:phosphomannomutase/phosphoglucomutase